MPEQNHSSTIKVAFPLATTVAVGLAFLTWAGFCYGVATAPQTFDGPWLRSTARILSVLLPALIFKIWVGKRLRSTPSSEDSPWQDGFCFRNRWVLGAAIGVVVAAIFFVVMYLDPMQRVFTPPGSFAAWLDLTGTPLVDEMLFRCVLAVQIFAISQSLDGAKGWDSWIAAVILSAAVFAAFQLPGWLITERFAPELVVKLAKEFGFGCALAIFFLATRSIWASLIPHWAYDFFWQSVGPV